MNKLFIYICENPEIWTHIRKLAKELCVSPNTIRKYAHELEGQGLIEKREYNTMIEYRGNLNSPSFTRKKLLLNMSNLYDSGLIDYLSDHYFGSAVILFGSYSKGEDLSSSDIDIAIISDSTSAIDVSHFEDILHRSISLHLVTFRKVSKEFQQTLINGIVLSNVLQW